MTGNAAPVVFAENGGEAGFTLIETLVAFAILALALGMFATPIGTAVLRSKSALRLLDAERLALSVLTKGSAGRQSLDASAIDPQTGLIWQRHVSAHLADIPGHIPFSLVTVEVRSSPDEPPIYRLKSLQHNESQR